MSYSDYKDSKTFCILPWVHLEIQQEGNTYPCCRSQFNEPIGNTHQNTPEEIWNSEKLRELRLKMINDEESSYCTDCYRTEACGATSLRIRHNLIHQNDFHLVDKTKADGSLENFSLKFLGLRFSNICNIKCQYCDHTYSTSWFSDQKALGMDPSQLRLTSSFNSNKDLLDFISRNLSSLESIYMAGGEPLLDKTHEALLEFLIDEDRTDIQLIYNTNLTTLKPFQKSIIEYWKEFDEVILDISIDSHGPRNDYIRHGSDWKKIEKNFLTLSKYKNIVPRVFCTVTVFNALTIVDSIKYWLSRGLTLEDRIIFNFLENPHYYNCQRLDPNTKLNLVKEIQDFSKEIFQNSEFAGAMYLTNQLKILINFLQVRDISNEDQNFSDKCDELDKVRGTSWRDIFPELK